MSTSHQEYCVKVRPSCICTIRRALTTLPIRSWVQVFEQDLFGDFAETTTGAVKRLIEEVVKTAPIDLKDKSEAQGMRAMDELKVNTKRIVACEEIMTMTSRRPWTAW